MGFGVIKSQPCKLLHAFSVNLAVHAAHELNLNENVEASNMHTYKLAITE